MPDNPLDDESHETMSRFEAATGVTPIELPEFEAPKKILVAFDQSEQDPTTAAVAKQVCEYYGASAVLLLPNLPIYRMQH